MKGKQEKKDSWGGFEGFSRPVTDAAGEKNNKLSIVVVFTTSAETLTALRYAAAWASQLKGHLRIIVAQVVPYPLPLDRPCVPPEFRVRAVRGWCEQEAVEARIDIRLCRNACECLKQELAPSSLVVLGVRKSWWPFTSEARLARALQRAGHQVLAVKGRFGAPS